MPDALPGFSISQVTTLAASFADDVATCGYFSDNGAFGNAFPDSSGTSLRPASPGRAQVAFERVWEARIREPVERVSPSS